MINDKIELYSIKNTNEAIFMKCQGGYVLVQSNCDWFRVGEFVSDKDIVKDGLVLLEEGASVRLVNGGTTWDTWEYQEEYLNKDK